ncbi:hypothetical protein AVEN_172416-1, partial [Araneus ventricosus]
MKSAFRKGIPSQKRPRADGRKGPTLRGSLMECHSSDVRSLREWHRRATAVWVSRSQ